jgi:hypothetical protein
MHHGNHCQLLESCFAFFSIEAFDDGNDIIDEGFFKHFTVVLNLGVV